MPIKYEVQMPTAYSYIRFSSEKQSLSDSVRRQTSMAQDYIQKHPELDLILDTELNMSDLGISAYSRKNMTDGAMGKFFDLTYEGKIEDGSYLLLENLDRFSRAPAWQATHDLTTLVKAGIIVVTLCDEQVYSKETLNAEAGSFKLMQSVMTFMRANQESEIKRDRVSKAWRNKMSKIKEGIQLTKRVPFWIEKEDRTKAIKEKVEIVRKIFKLSADGLGAQRIASVLNHENVPTPTGKTRHWAISSVKKVLKSPAVSGVLITADGERHDGYYPKIISDKLAEKANLLSKTSKGTRDTSNTHPLSGLCFCACCGARAQRSGKTGRVRKDGTKNVWRVLVCANSLNKASNCLYQSISYNLILETTLSAIFQTQYVQPSDEIGKELHDLEWGLSAVEDIYYDLREVIKKERNNQTARQEYTKLTSEIDSMKERISELKAMKRPLTERQVEGARRALLTDKQHTNNNFRTALKRVDIDFDKRILIATGHDGKVVQTEIQTNKEMIKNAL